MIDPEALSFSTAWDLPCFCQYSRENRHTTSCLVPLPQLTLHDDYCCDLVPPVLHEVLDGRLSQTGLVPSIVSAFASQQTYSCRKSLQPAYF